MSSSSLDGVPYVIYLTPLNVGSRRFEINQAAGVSRALAWYMHVRILIHSG